MSIDCVSVSPLESPCLSTLPQIAESPVYPHFGLAAQCSNYTYFVSDSQLLPRVLCSSRPCQPL